jgi:ribose transport system ATP-binding protein
VEGNNNLIVQCEGICKSFFGVPVLRNVDLALSKGRVLGLIGENGAGKSTLMNILGGIIPADSGRIRLDGSEYSPKSAGDAARRGIEFIHQEPNLFSNLSIAENIFISAFPRRKWPAIPLIDKQTLRARTKALIESVDLHCSADTLVEDLAPGERQLVEIAKALSIDAKLIIFDEPTTSLSLRESDRLFRLIQRLRTEGISVIYISHVLSDVLGIADDILVLRDGQVVGKGPRSDFTQHKMISLMVGRDLQRLFPPRSSTPQTEKLLEVSSLTQPSVIKNISFTLSRGEVLGLFGLMGSGRSELARILFGLDASQSGEILLRGIPLPRSPLRARIKSGLAFVTEDRRGEGLLMGLGIEENVALTALPAFARKILGVIDEDSLHRVILQMIDSLRLGTPSFHRQRVETLSGGNQQKIVLARWLLASPLVLMLDEPTRGIDVGAKYEIYRIINDRAAHGCGVFFISSEIEELLGMCDRILVMSQGEIRDSFERSEFDTERILRSAFGDGARS